MRARGTKPKTGQRWAATSWNAAGEQRIVEVIRIDGDHVYVRRITGSGGNERRILAESLLAKYSLLPAERK